MGAGSAKAKGMRAPLGSLQRGNPQASPRSDKERIMRARMEEQAMRSRKTNPPGSLQRGNPQASPRSDKERIMRARMEEQAMRARMEEQAMRARMEEQAMRARMEQEKARSQAGRASMFPGEAPPPSPARVPGTEEAMYRRGDLTRARDSRPGAREEMYNNFARAEAERMAFNQRAQEEKYNSFARAEAERRASNQGARSGIMFGPGRANRMPEPGSPEYNQLIQRARRLKR